MTTPELKAAIAREMEELLYSILARGILYYEGEAIPTYAEIEQYVARQKTPVTAEIMTLFHYWFAFSDLPGAEYMELFLETLRQCYSTPRDLARLHAKITEERG